MKAGRTCLKFFTVEPTRTTFLRKSRRRWEDNIIMDLEMDVSSSDELLQALIDAFISNRSQQEALCSVKTIEHQIY